MHEWVEGGIKKEEELHQQQCVVFHLTLDLVEAWWHEVLKNGERAQCKDEIRS